MSKHKPARARRTDREALLGESKGLRQRCRAEAVVLTDALNLLRPLTHAAACEAYVLLDAVRLRLVQAGRAPAPPAIQKPTPKSNAATAPTATASASPTTHNR